MSDLISRQAAIDAARDWYEGLICGSFKGLEKRLRALPSAQPEWKKGNRWTHYDRNCTRHTVSKAKDYPNCTFMFDCVLPDDGDEILVSNRRFVWMDTFCSDIDGCYLDSGDDIDEDMAWMPLPKPYKGGDDE